MKSKIYKKSSSTIPDPNGYRAGYSLVETLAYVAILAILVAAVAYATNALFIANKKIKAARQIENSAIASLDRMVRDIRAASDIVAGESSLSTGTLVLTIPVSEGVTRKTKFYLDSATKKISVYDNDILTGQLSLSGVQVTSLVFTKLTSEHSNAIKIVLTMTSTITGLSDTFYTTAVMRGSY